MQGHKSRFLGYLSAVANPLAFCFVYDIAFHRIMRVRMEHYELFLLTGLFPRGVGVRRDYPLRDGVPRQPRPRPQGEGCAAPFCR